MSTGRKNQSRGKALEQWIVNRVKKLGLNLIVKHIDRKAEKRFASIHDIEFCDFRDVVVDAKFTEGSFTVNEKKRLIADVTHKYGGDTIQVIVICGEKRNTTRLQPDNILACWIKCGMLIQTPIDDWLVYLDNVKSNNGEYKYVNANAPNE